MSSANRKGIKQDPELKGIGLILGQNQPDWCEEKPIPQSWWQVGRLFHQEGSEELSAWVDPLTQLLHQGASDKVLQELRSCQAKCLGPGSKQKRETIAKAVNYLEKRQTMMAYGQWREQGLVLASGVVEGAARYVIGERLDQSGMRWTVDKAETLLQLRCIEVNGDWDEFFAWTEQRRLQELGQGHKVQIRSKEPTVRAKTLKETEKRRKRRKKAQKGEATGQLAA
jgi:hypothetical protein